VKEEKARKSYKERTEELKVLGWKFWKSRFWIHNKEKEGKNQTCGV